MAGALEELPGVQAVQVDLGTKEVRVSYDPARVSTETLREAVERVDVRLRIRHWVHRFLGRRRR